MITTAEFKPMSKSRKDAPVNVPRDLAKKIKFVADHLEKSVAEYLQPILEATVSSDFKKAVNEIQAELENETKKARK